MDIKNTDRQYVMNTYNRFDLLIERGEGCYCYDEKGNRYTDLTSGIGVNCLGYCDCGWADAVAKQARTLSHTSNLFYTEPCVKLAKTLCERTGAKKVFFSNSGAEANEGAIKVARKYSFDKYGEGRNVVVTLRNSFHGRTITTLAATGQDVFHNYFFPFTEGFRYVESGNIDALRDALDGSVCAVMIEFIQGEGGVIAQDKDYIKAVRALCDEKDVLLIADEVQTGIGRTGTLLASENYGIKPDVTTLAKGLGGGLPIGAVAVYGKAENVMGFSSHGSTFGGNPIVCAGALEVLSRIDEEFLKEVVAKGDFARRKLEGAKGVESVSGLGLMIGIKPADGRKSADIVKKGIERGVLMLTAKDKIRLLPPLTITEKQLGDALDILLDILAE